MSIVLKRPRAAADLVDIWGYIAEDSEERADAFIDEIDRKLRTLAERPGIGRLRNELAEGLRGFPVGRYVIFYLVIPDGIELVRVLHGERDLDTIFHADD